MSPKAKNMCTVEKQKVENKQQKNHGIIEYLLIGIWFTHFVPYHKE